MGYDEPRALYDSGRPGSALAIIIEGSVNPAVVTRGAAEAKAVELGAKNTGARAVALKEAAVGGVAANGREATAVVARGAVEAEARAAGVKETGARAVATKEKVATAVVAREAAEAEAVAAGGGETRASAVATKEAAVEMAAAASVAEMEVAKETGARAVAAEQNGSQPSPSQSPPVVIWTIPSATIAAALAVLKEDLRRLPANPRALAFCRDLGVVNCEGGLSAEVSVSVTIRPDGVKLLSTLRYAHM